MRYKTSALKTKEFTEKVSLEPVDNRRLADLCGERNEHLRQLEAHFGVQINNRGHIFHVIGEPDLAKAAVRVLSLLYDETLNGDSLTASKIYLIMRENSVEAANQPNDDSNQESKENVISIKTKHGLIRARGKNQGRFLQRIQHNPINFAVGPAGTGKTYLAVANAVDALEKDEVLRVVLVRPAVEAGERLGFLPGDLTQKIDPYLRPLYDALYEMLGFERVSKLIENNIIEIAPLAYMRGRNLNDSFIILDEGQNTTREQMKMFLTRIGFGSTAVITGDITQIDLPKSSDSGLIHAISVLKDIEGISITRFEACDVVRHPIVQAIIEAYETHLSNAKKESDD